MENRRVQADCDLSNFMYIDELGICLAAIYVDGSIIAGPRTLVKYSAFFQPKYRLGHPKNHLFSLSEQKNSGSKYPKNSSFNFKIRITGQQCVRFQMGYSIKVR